MDAHIKTVLDSAKNEDEKVLAREVSKKFEQFKKDTKGLHPFSNDYQEMKTSVNLAIGRLIGRAEMKRELETTHGK